MSELKNAIRCEKITKRFGSVVANDQIDLEVRYGEVLALLGENGSGKTTLMNMLSGIYHPDQGRIFVDEQEASINSPADSQRLGIGMIHQHFKLVEAFTAMENIELGTPGKKLKAKELKAKVEQLCASYGLEIDPAMPVEQMSVSQKQTVEILKVLYRGAKILILDEPTAVLTPQETNKLFNILNQMRQRGCAVIIITHKLAEVLAISDRVTILRKGQSVETVPTRSCDASKLTELMVGHPINMSIDRPKTGSLEELLHGTHLSVRRADGALALDDISFEMRAGEILGVAGIAGSGQKELCETVAGLMNPEKGAILFKKVDLSGKTPRQIIEMGISMSFVPEDRLGMGLVAGMGMTDNMLLKSYQDGKGPLLRREPARKLAASLKDQLEIKTPSIEMPVRMMSGGNVQKVLLGRELAAQPQLLITAYPVRGLDSPSSLMIYQMLNQQKQRDVAVMYIGEDLDVLLALCDRVMVLCHGKITGILDAKQVTKEQIGLMMTGMTAQEVMKG